MATFFESFSSFAGDDVFANIPLPELPDICVVQDLVSFSNTGSETESESEFVSYASVESPITSNAEFSLSTEVSLLTPEEVHLEAWKIPSVAPTGTDRLSTNRASALTHRSRKNQYVFLLEEELRKARSILLAIQGKEDVSAIKKKFQKKRTERRTERRGRNATCSLREPAQPRQ